MTRPMGEPTPGQRTGESQFAIRQLQRRPSPVAGSPFPFFVNVVSPYYPGFMNVNGSMGAGNLSVGMRVIINEAGTLRDFAIYVHTSSGNIDAGIYRLTSEPRTRVWSSGSVACPAAGAWRIVGDPNVAVLAGEQYDFVLWANNATAQFGRVAATISAASSQLPTGYLSEVGVSPRMMWQRADASALPATITEASLAQTTAPFSYLCRLDN